MKEKMAKLASAPSSLPPPTRRQVLIVSLLFLIYVAAFFVLFGHWRTNVGVFVTIPALTAGWFWGLRAGFVVALLCLPLNIVLNITVGIPIVDAFLRKGGLMGGLALVLVNVMVGWARDTNHRLNEEIKERKRAEEELEEALLEKESALQGSQFKSLFLADMSHEIRTPLNAVIGYSELLLEVAVEQNQDMFVPDLEKIQTAGHHLLQLINDILDLSKIEAGKMVFATETFVLSTVFKDAEDLFNPLAQQNDNTLSIVDESDAGEMIADPVRFRQILFNLLSNACKFTSQGQVSLCAKREARGEEQGFVFQVIDTGIGMSQAQSARVFETFIQAHHKIEHQFGGTGLGMSISYKLCTMMGGEISLESELEHGTTVTIWLPAKAKKLPAQSWSSSQLPAYVSHEK